MAEQLSPQVEAFIAEALAQGEFPSRQALLESAVEALRREHEVSEIPEIHREAVEQGLESIRAGRVAEWSAADAIRRLDERLAKRAETNGQ